MFLFKKSFIFLLFFAFSCKASNQKTQIDLEIDKISSSSSAYVGTCSTPPHIPIGQPDGTFTDSFQLSPDVIINDKLWTHDSSLTIHPNPDDLLTSTPNNGSLRTSLNTPTDSDNEDDSEQNETTSGKIPGQYGAQFGSSLACITSIMTNLKEDLKRINDDLIKPAPGLKAGELGEQDVRFIIDC